MPSDRSQPRDVNVQSDVNGRGASNRHRTSTRMIARIHIGCLTILAWHVHYSEKGNTYPENCCVVMIGYLKYERVHKTLVNG